VQRGKLFVLQMKLAAATILFIFHLRDFPVAAAILLIFHLRHLFVDGTKKRMKFCREVLVVLGKFQGYCHLVGQHLHQIFHGQNI
jgi:hypothetical protein